MAIFLKEIEIGDDKYYISRSDDDDGDLYYSRSSKDGGFSIKGAKFKKNQFVNSDGKAISEFDLAQAIENSK